MNFVEPKAEKIVERIELPVVGGGVDFDEFVKRALTIKEQCTDHTYVPRPEQITACFDENMGLRFVDSEDEQVRTTLSKFALSQLCTKLGVPVRYLEKCIETGNVDLAQTNMNTWLNDYDRQLLFRMYKNKVRGVLSTKYSALDTPDILDILDTALEMENYLIKGAYLNEERLHMRVTQKTMMNIEGEDLYAGMQIDSSDVGRSTLMVQFFIYKQVCTNGLAISKGSGMLFVQKHIGIDKDEFYGGMRDAVAMLPSLVTEYEEVVRMNQNLALSDPKANIEKVREQLKMSEKNAEHILEVMEGKYTRTNWGLINTLTEVAQDFGLERRLEIERYAGNLLLSA